jgi:hypothetical protein
MQLRNTRLCLDCEELHEDQQCPVCASETFAFLTRWIPVDERRQQNRTRAGTRSAARPQNASGMGTGRWMMGGAVGVAVFAIGRFLLKTSRPAEWIEPASGSRDDTP